VHDLYTKKRDQIVEYNYFSQVGSSEAALLQKLNIRPFTYGFTIQSIYDNGAIFSPEVSV
jgi:hypothetical protein